MAPVSLEPLDTGSLTSKVRARLVEAIADGAFGELLPSEQELCRQLGVSRPTVRAALRSLEDSGLITRRRGVGARVNSHVSRIRLNLDRVLGFWDLIREAGHEPRISSTAVHLEPAGPEVVSRLGCAPEEELMVIERLFLADGEPAIKVREMILSAALTAAVPTEAMPESIFEFAARYTPSPIDHTIVEIIPEVAADGMTDALGLAPGTPLLRLLETHYSAVGQVVMFSEVFVVDRFVRFNVVRRRS